ncbi:MAG: hypothetical protein NTV21_11020 [Planctomycetota bacterium]|nr:hypothetical protein [Planctomycetota bacterium]
MSTVDEINARFESFMIVERLVFSPEPGSACASIVLELRSNEPTSTRRIRVQAGGVAIWRLSGDLYGLVQLGCLRVTDVHHRQWDGVRYELDELEDRRIWLLCDSLSVETISPGP